jgi:hypothetical protein
MVTETRLKQIERKLETGFAELRKLLMGKHAIGHWVSTPVACAMINVKPRQLRNLRIHKHGNGKAVGFIRWRKGKGRIVQYHKGDLEKYMNQITVQ